MPQPGRIVVLLAKKHWNEAFFSLVRHAEKNLKTAWTERLRRLPCLTDNEVEASNASFWGKETEKQKKGFTLELFSGNLFLDSTKEKQSKSNCRRTKKPSRTRWQAGFFLEEALATTLSLQKILSTKLLQKAKETKSSVVFSNREKNNFATQKKCRFKTKSASSAFGVRQKKENWALEKKEKKKEKVLLYFPNRQKKTF